MPRKLNVEADFRECPGDELPDRMVLPGGDHVVVRPILLHHQMHRPHVIAGVPPVPKRVQVAEIERVFETEDDPRYRPRDLAGDEGLAPDRALVVEKDPVGGMDPVRLTVVDRDPVGVQLGGGIGAARGEGGGLPLGRLSGVAVELRGGGLIVAAALLLAQYPDGLQQSKCAQGVGVSRVLGRFERHLNVRLRGQVVDLVRLSLLDNPDEVRRVGHVPVVHEEAAAGDVRVLVEVIDPVGIDEAGTPLYPVDDVALVDEQFGE